MKEEKNKRKIIRLVCIQYGITKKKITVATENGRKVFIRIKGGHEVKVM